MESPLTHHTVMSWLLALTGGQDICLVQAGKGGRRESADLKNCD